MSRTSNAFTGVAMKSVVPVRIRTFRSEPLRAIALAFAVLAGACQAQTLDEVSASTSPALKQTLQDLRPAYRQQQFLRLAQNRDRDSLIAAVWIGMPTTSERRPLDGLADVAQRLNQAYGS